MHDWSDRQDFDFASRGLIARPGDSGIVDDKGHELWNHDRFEAFLHGEAPETVHPSLWRHALLNNHRGLFEVCPGVWQVRGESLANVTFVATDHGYVAIDPLTTVEVAAYALALLFEHVGPRPILGIVYSHSHSDHFGGVEALVSEEDVRSGQVWIVAPEGFADWVLKEQGLAAEGMPSRNDYMYGENLVIGPTGLVDDGLGQAMEGGRVSYLEPTDLVGADGATLFIDGLEMQFMLAPGEAPAGIHTYLPAYKTLHVADNCYMCLQNVYTIRGAFPRDAMAWASSVGRSLHYDETECLISGHNWPVFGRQTVARFLADQRDGVRYMHDQTLRLMGLGYGPAEIADRIRFPPALERLWHLRGYYGSLKHNVRGIYAYYLGWYDGNPATLDALPPRELAARTLSYMGGVDAVVERTRQALTDGDYRWVVHILDQVLWAEPDHVEARDMAAAAHTQLGYAAENATWRNAYLSAAQELRYGLPSSQRNHRVLRDVVKGMGAVQCLNSMSIRLDGLRAVDVDLSVNWVLSDRAERCSTRLGNSVLHHRSGLDPDADVTVTLPHAALSEAALGEIGHDDLEGRGAVVNGDAASLAQLFDLLDVFPRWFPIASHTLKQHEALTPDGTTFGG